MPALDPVEQLHPDQPGAGVGEGVEHRTNRQNPETDQQYGLASPAVGVPPDQQRYRQHDHLRGDDAGRHHRRRPRLVRERELLADEREQRRVGEMEQHRAAGIKQQRPAGQQHFETGGLRLAVILLVAAARAVVVDGAGRDRQHRQSREHGKDRDQQEHRALRQSPADGACRRGDRNIAAMVECGVAAHAGGQRGAGIKAQGQCRDAGPNTSPTAAISELAAITGQNVGAA